MAIKQNQIFLRQSSVTDGHEESKSEIETENDQRNKSGEG